MIGIGSSPYATAATVEMRFMRAVVTPSRAGAKLKATEQ
jgi:hypothetical protein